MAALIAACTALVLLAAVVALLRTALTGRGLQATAGAIIGGAILYVVLGYAYALLTADPTAEGPSDCPGPPYSTC